MLGGMQMLIADMEERDRERNEKLSLEAQRRLRTDSFQNIIAELQRNSEHKMNCPICLKDFEDHDQATVLNCDNRHIFHPECIRESLKHKLECPLCRKPVQTGDESYDQERSQQHR